MIAPAEQSSHSTAGARGVDPTLGSWIRAARQAAKPRLTLERLGEAAGVDPSAIHALETRCKPLREATMRRIAARLGLDVDELLVRSGIVPEDVVAWLTAGGRARISAVRAPMAEQKS